MVLSLAPSVFAAEDDAGMSVSFDNTTPNPGDTITALVTVESDFSAAMAYESSFYFDKELLTVEKIEILGAPVLNLTTVDRANTSGRVRFAEFNRNYDETIANDRVRNLKGDFSKITLKVSEYAGGKTATGRTKGMAWNSKHEYVVRWEGSYSLSIQGSETARPTATGYTVSMATDRTSAVGETVSIPVTVASSEKKITGFNAYDMTFTYNPAALTLNTAWEQLDMLKDAGSGKATFTFTVPKDEGTYYIVGFDPNRKIPTDDSGGTNYAKIAPATAILTVSGTAELERPFQTVSVDGKALDGKNISYEGIVSLGSEDNEEFRNVYEEVPKYHVIVPEGTKTVDITYGKDVDIYHADATAYGYETDLAADAVSSATIRSVTLEGSYTANDDGTQTVTTPVTRYVRNADGTAMAVTLESGSGKNFRPVALFTFEYAKAEPDPEPEVKYGDVNGDSTIDVSDALLICQIYLANVTPTDAQKAAADVNGDGTADVSDALMVCQYYLGNIRYPGR